MANDFFIQFAINNNDNFCRKKAVLLLVFVIFPSIVATKPPKFQAQKPCKRLVLFYHDIIFGGTNATAAAVANATNLGIINFGLVC